MIRKMVKFGKTPAPGGKVGIPTKRKRHLLAIITGPQAQALLKWWDSGRPLILEDVTKKPGGPRVMISVDEC